MWTDSVVPKQRDGVKYLSVYNLYTQCNLVTLETVIMDLISTIPNWMYNNCVSGRLHDLGGGYFSHNLRDLDQFIYGNMEMKIFILMAPSSLISLGMSIWYFELFEIDICTL